MVWYVGVWNSWAVMVVWRKSTAGGRVATARPLLSARAMPHFYPCGVRATAAHKYVRSFTHTHGAVCYWEEANSFSCTCSVSVCSAACLGATANSLRGVNFQQTQTSRKTFTKVNYSTKFQSVEGSELVKSLLLMRRDGETSESKADLLLLGSFNKT